MEIASGVYRAYVYNASGQLLALQSYYGDFYWIHQDHLGSGRKLTDTSGTVVYRAEFDPHGQALYEWSNVGEIYKNSHKFTGYERDFATNLDNAKARMYNHNRGRFMQPDPLGLAAADRTDPQSLNQYSYVGNDPVNFADPSGMVEDDTIRIETWERYLDWGFFWSCYFGGVRWGAGGGLTDPSGEVSGGQQGGGGQQGPGQAVPTTSNNPSCNDFVDQLLNYFFDQSYTRLDAGYGMIRLAIANRNFNGQDFVKNMPGEPAVGGLNGTPQNFNGFRPELVDNDQRGDVYHHVQFMVGSQLVPVGPFTGSALAMSDMRQRFILGRAESITELRDDVAGFKVGGVLLNMRPFGLPLASREDIRDAIRGILCTP